MSGGRIRRMAVSSGRIPPCESQIASMTKPKPAVMIQVTSAAHSMESCLLCPGAARTFFPLSSEIENVTRSGRRLA
jgi:hypothetical protein